MTLQVINDFNLRMWARILVTAPAGPQVARALEQIHILADGVWEHEHMAGQSALYEVYHQLVSDAQALELAGQASPARPSPGPSMPPGYWRTSGRGPAATTPPAGYMMPGICRIPFRSDGRRGVLTRPARRC